MNSTNIQDLPTDPSGGGSISGNVSLMISETSPPISSDGGAVPATSTSSSGSLDQNTINHIINTLQQASITGATNLPNRDIPRTSELQDPFVQPNYVPPAARHSYIEQDESNERMIQRHEKEEANARYMDSVYNELQTPLLLSLLYFIFQLPFFKTLCHKYLPTVLNKDGNWNLNGLLMSSLFFGGSFYFISKTMAQVNRLV